MKKSKIIIIAAILLSLIIIGFIWQMLDIPLFKSDKKINISIPQGSSTSDIANILKQNDLIDSKLIFLIKVKFSEYRSSLNYGNFTLSKNMSVKEIIKTLAETHYNQNTITITFPEGSSLEQMALILEEKGIVSAEDFLNALLDEYNYEFIKYIPQGSYKYRLQGMLFPDTYEFFTTATAHEIIDKMLSHFEEKYSAESKDFTNVFEVITKASIIEKEAKLERERPTVAGVINNRLNINMPLQIDACVVYAVTDGKYDIDKVYNSHLKIDSPYNTYKYKGLTPGPICCPGITSIRAALNPEAHEYLYYHTDEKKADGSHIFTKTFDSHLETMN